MHGGLINTGLKETTKTGSFYMFYTQKNDTFMKN